MSAAILRIGRKQRYPAAFFIRQDAIAVVFFFVNPAGLLKRIFDQRRQHGLNSKGNTSAHLLALERTGAFAGSPLAAFATSPPSSSAISASRRLVRTERGFSTRMSSVEA